MQAIISACAGLAGLIDGDNAWLIHAGDDSEHATNVDSVRNVLSVYGDAIHLPDTDKRAALEVLNRESQKDEALLLLLAILDSRTAPATQARAASYLESHLAKEHTTSYLNGVLYSRPLPEGSISKVPKSLISDFPSVHSFVSGLIDSQSKIAEIYELISSTASSFHLPDADREKIEGVFCNLCVIEALCNPTIDRSVQDQIRFNCLRRLSDVYAGRQIVTKLFSKFMVERDDTHDTVTFPPISTAAVDEGFQPSRVPKQPIHEVYQDVQAQMSKVISLLKSGKVDRARRSADWLVENQLARGDSAYAAMSLCNLSEAAKNLKNYSLQLSWAQQASRIAPDDPRTFVHVGEAFLNVDRFKEATEAFEKCKDAGDVVYGTNGIARILQLMFRYEDALALLDGLVLEGYKDSSIDALRAGVLRDLRRSEEAAEVYKNLMTDCPETSHPMCGYAASHADMRQFDKAESIYKKANKLYPNDHVPLSGLGFILIRQGHFRQGLKYLNESIALNKTGDIIPLSSKITALRWRGRYDAAMDLSHEMIEKEAFDANWRLLLIHTYIDAGDYQRALEEIESVDDVFPGNARNARFRALVFRRRGRLSEALAVLDTLKAKYPLWLEVLIDRGNVLKHAGEYELSRQQFQDVLRVNPHNRRAHTSLAILNVLMSKIDERAMTISTDAPITVGDWQSFHSQALVLLASNQVKSAKNVVLKGVNKCPFHNIRPNFEVTLAAARTMLGQTGTAWRTAKHAIMEVGFIQQTIVLGELGREKDARSILAKLDKSRSDTSNVINLIERRYFSESAQSVTARPSIEEVMKCQLETILLAA